MNVLRFTIGPRILLVVMIVIGSTFSVRGVAFYYLIATILIAPYSIYYAASMLKSRFIDIALPLVRIFLCTVAAGILLYLIKQGLFVSSVFLLLCTSFLIFLVVYSIFIYYCAPAARREFFVIFKKADNS